MNSLATNRDSLLRIAADTLAHLQAPETEAVLEGGLAASPETSPLAQKDAVVNALTAALDFARLEGSLLRSVPEAVAESADNVPYVPSNQALALLQSAIEEHTETQAPGAEAAFDTSDPGWIKSALEKLKAIFRGKHKFTAHTSATSFHQPLPADAVVALYSDWGTGEETARRVMAQIKAAQPTHAIHLGDVYYSGTEKEIRKRFLQVIDEAGPLPASCRFFALNSNHEMYSGGHAYFDLTLPRFGQEASYFNLHNDNWQLIGLDSGYEDHGLRDPQGEWLAAQLAAGGRRNILLTHHQLFSPFEDRGNGRKLEEKTAHLLPEVFAWFWGHEHKAIVFDKHRGIKARCIGHGAIPTKVPYGTPQFPGIPVHRIDERAAPGGTQALHGFALLRFNHAALDVSYVDEFGTTWFEESLTSP